MKYSLYFVLTLCCISTCMGRAAQKSIYTLISKNNIQDIKKRLELQPLLVFEKDHWGLTLLHFAVNQRKKEVVKLLVVQGAPLDATDAHGQTALHHAVETDEKPCARILLKAGAQPNIRNDVGDTPLHVASFYGRVDLMRLLIKHEADVNRYNYLRRTPLHSAAFSKNNDQALEMLLQSGAELNAVDGAGQTALQIAVEHRNERNTQTLMRAGALLQHKDRQDIFNLWIANKSIQRARASFF